MRLWSVQPDGALAFQFRRFRAAGHTLQAALDFARRELDRKPVQRLRDAAGNFAPYAWPGCYPMVYVTERGGELCPACASDDAENADDPVIDGDVYWEGPTRFCDGCCEEIESAYGDPDAEDEEVPS